VSFRIRGSCVDEDPNWEGKQKAYWEHLRQFNKRNNSDLWRYFYWDFFHDGWFDKISVSPGKREVSFDIWAPNIKRFLGDDKYEYLNVQFLCTFRNVVYFSMEGDLDETLQSTDIANAKFLASEISSRDDLVARHASTDKDWSDLYSLIIELDKGYLTLVFETVNVVPAEPVAFALILNSKEFEVPIFRVDHDEA
jgi:hypothetical protein